MAAPVAVSPLKPVDPASLPDFEKEEQAPWIMRKLVGSMVGRIVMASFETLKASGTNVVCLSAWGDSSPLFLPCIMWRDVIIHTVIAATGGTAAIAAPAMGPMIDTVVATVGDSIAVELSLRVGYDVGIKVADDLLFDKTIKSIIPTHSKRLETTGVKTLVITAKYKHTQMDAALGYFRASVHGGDVENGLFSTISDYLSIEKGWWNPVLFASGRRPCIPRSMKPDVVFCHGPFHQADYRVAQSLLSESASVIVFAQPETPSTPPPAPTSSTTSDGNADAGKKEGYHFGDYSKKGLAAAEGYLKVGQGVIDQYRNKSRPSSPTPTPSSPAPVDSTSTAAVSEKPLDAEGTSEPAPSDDALLASTPSTIAATTPPLRRLAILLVGISPHRKLWTTSARPGESVIGYTLLNGAPAIVVPAEDGCPLMAWDTLTLESLHKIGKVEGEKFDGVVNVLFEYVALCADWERFVFPESLEETESGAAGEKMSKEETAKKLTKDALMLLVAAAIRSKDSKEVKKHVDPERAGIVMLRLP